MLQIICERMIQNKIKLVSVERNSIFDKRETNKLLFGVWIPNDFSGIPNCFSNEGYQKAKDLMYTQLK